VRTAVDTNVLIDLVASDEAQAVQSRKCLSDAFSVGTVVICDIVFAELTAGIEYRTTAHDLLEELGIAVERLSAESLRIAASAWRTYLSRRGETVQCPKCGARAVITCQSCGATIAWRQHIITDFLIGAHALRQCDQLLTRDAGYYRTYFPELKVVIP
jgi:hypothetical protein